MQIANKNTSEHYKWGDNCEGWHLVKNNNLSVIRELVPPGKSEIKHYHSRSRQFFFVLEGIATMELPDITLEIKKYEGLEIAPLTEHRLSNGSDSDLEFLVISHPPGHDDRITV